ncbi:hypothetical protein ACGYJ8_15425 [Sulfitobacter sp. 1A12126]
MRDPRNGEEFEERMPPGRGFVIGAIAGLAFWAAVGLGFLIDMAF